MAPRQAYVPPHRRGRQNESDAPCTLEMLCPVDRWQIRLERSHGFDLDLEKAPLPVIDGPGALSSGGDERQPPRASSPAGPQPEVQEPEAGDAVKGFVLEMAVLGHWQEEMQELLQWFHDAVTADSPQWPGGDVRSCLVLPATLTKAQRAAWHRAAQAQGLRSSSSGVQERRLKVCHPAAGPDDSELHRTAASGMQARRYRLIWAWCQEEGGALWAYSQKQIVEIMEGPQDQIPQDLRELIAKREAAADLFACLRHTAPYDEVTVESIQLLEQQPDLLWVRADRWPHGYPLHTIAAEGLADVLLWIREHTNLETLTQQKDRAGKRAVDVAIGRCRNLLSLYHPAVGTPYRSQGRQPRPDRHQAGRSRRGGRAQGPGAALPQGGRSPDLW